MSGGFREIKSFLDVTCYEDESRKRPDVHAGLFPFITISREVGAGGRRLARTLIEVMENHPSEMFRGWKVLDRESFEGMIRDERLRSAFDAVFSEECHSEIEALVRTLLGSSSAQPAAVSHLFQAIRKMATCGKVIIVGRAGSCVTASLPLGVHLRLVAPESQRIRELGLQSLGESEARKELARRDRDRARLVQIYFRREISDPNLYDVIWNSARTPMEVIALATLTLVEERAVAHGLMRRRKTTHVHHEETVAVPER